MQRKIAAPQPLIARLQHTSTCDDMAGGDGEFKLSMIGPGWFRHDATHMAASKRLVDSEVTHPREAEQTENICPNMTNKEFVALVLRLRDKAISLIEKRMRDLERWGGPSAGARRHGSAPVTKTCGSICKPA